MDPDISDLGMEGRNITFQLLLDKDNNCERLCSKRLDVFRLT